MNIQTNLTRRAALAGTAALPALALAIPAAAETEDPAVAAFHVFKAAAERHEVALLKRAHMIDFGPDKDPGLAEAEAEEGATGEAELAALDALAGAAATTTAGLHCQFIALCFMTLERVRGGCAFDPEDYEVEGYGPTDLDLSGRMVSAVNCGLLRLAGRAQA